MEEIKHQRHTKETTLYSLSRMFERASFFGLRALLLLYMTSEVLRMDRADAYQSFALLTSGVFISHIIGALLGDLVIGNRKSIIAGGFIQAFGAFCLCIPSLFGLYAGLFLVIIGNGLYVPNFTANFGKLFLDKTKLLDAGFTWLYFVINVGAIIGIVFLGLLGETYGFNVGFLLSGVLMVLSIIPIVLSKKTNPIREGGQSDEWAFGSATNKDILDIDQQATGNEEAKGVTNGISINKRVAIITSVFLLVGLFWYLYETTNGRFLQIESFFVNAPSFNLPEFAWSSGSSTVILPLSIVMAIFWSYFYSSPFFKLMLGFIFGTISFGVLFMIPETLTDSHAVLYLVALLFWGLAEVIIGPLLYSVLTKYTNPNYLAILISLSTIPTRAISILALLSMSLVSDEYLNSPILQLRTALIVMAIISVGLIGFVVWKKFTTVTSNN